MADNLGGFDSEEDANYYVIKLYVNKHIKFIHQGNPQTTKDNLIILVKSQGLVITAKQKQELLDLIDRELK